MQDYGSIGKRGTSHPCLSETCSDQRDDCNISHTLTYPGCRSNNGDNHTFPKFPSNGKQIRNESASLPYLSFGCENARSFMSVESPGNNLDSHCDDSFDQSVSLSSTEVCIL